MDIKNLVNKALDAGILLSAREGRLVFEVTGAPMSVELREELREHRDALLAYLGGMGAAVAQTPGVTNVPRIQRRPPGGDRPLLSYAQHRLWFIDRMGGSSQYNMPSAYRLKGSLDRSAFARAFRDVIQRHEVLRTNFVEEHDSVFQHIHDAIELPLVEMDLRALPVEEREEEVHRIFNHDAVAPYDLALSPLIRIHLLALAGDEHVVIVNMHHIVSDGWSIDVLVREFAVLYAAYQGGHQPELEPLAIQYADYAQLQRTWMEGEAVEGQLAFWRAQLAGIPAVHNLPLDKPRGSQQDFSGGTHVQAFGPKLSARIRQFCKERDVTPFMFLETAFALLVHRLSHAPDVVIGTPVAGREHRETQALIGFFVNTLVVRSRFEAELSFDELLRRNKSTILDVFSYQHTPFELLVEEIKPARSLSYNPIFQLMFNVQSVGQSELALPGLTLTPLFARTGVTKFDLSVDVTESRAGMTAVWGYKTSLFREETVARFAESYRLLLEGVLHNPLADTAQLPILPEGDLEMLTRWNRTDHPFPDTCIHTLFEAQAARTPDAVAVSYAGARLSYAELDAQANRLAHGLRARGVVGDTLVGVAMERSLDMVIALLGILKAGGAYVPLDPSYPDDRLRFMAKDAQVRLVLTQQRFRPRWQGFGTSCLAVDDPELLQAAGSPVAPVAAAPDPSGLAYVIYTSGSTGTPKGVMNSHRALANRIDWMQREYLLQPDDRVLQKTPYSFDVSVWEFFWPLTVGASIVMARPEGHKDPLYLRDVIREEGVTTLHFVPSMLASLLDAIDWAGLTCVRRVFASGEALSQPLVERYWATGTTASLHNLYGPTEAAIDVSYWDCRQSTEDQGVPIGRPISNVQLHVLDAHRQHVPVGCFGELHIGGVAVAKGYVGNAELTREKFIADPFSNVAGARLYKTGDLARWLPGGYLEFAGRLDHQVKLNGVRIELGEIEAHLRAQADVGDCVVIADSERPDHQHLVAYVVSLRIAGESDTEDWQARRNEETSILKSGLKQHLPDFMVPSLFVFLDALPLSANGKVDRKALARPSAPVAHRAYVAPRQELERELCRIWEEVLHVDEVGIHDSYFDIGGTSLLCIKVQKRINDRLGRAVALTDIFEFPTVSELASHLRRPSGPSSDTAIRADDGGRTRQATADIAIIGMAGRFPEANDVDAFWRNLAAGHEALREFSDEELLAAGISRQQLDAPDYVKRGVLLDGLDQFDAAFFGLTPREAEVLDPQQRLLFECAVEALEHAGYGDGTRPRAVGVFVGQSESQYLVNHLLGRQDLQDSLGVALLHANSKEYTSTRLSYKLNLSGPSVSLGTACSTSLVAVHLACMSLLQDECRMALAGAASVSLLEPQGYVYREGGIASPDGHCRAFDAAAAGTRAGSGAGLVLLKRLEDALADGDTIHAVIKGSATNNDGAVKVGYTAPSVSGQAAVIRQAQRRAGVSAESIGYIETHGTGTRIGDPIEIKALANAFAEVRHAGCRLGTLKPNIGHLDTAAGIAGLIKTVQVLKHKQFPPAINYGQANPQIEFGATPFEINTSLRPWEAGAQPRRAGVSSFGIGGTNAHVILEEAPPIAGGHALDGHVLLPVSAKSAAALSGVKSRLARHLRDFPGQSLADVAYTLQVGRTPHAYRFVVHSSDALDAAARLEDASPSQPAVMVKEGQRVDIVIMFPGQGAQYTRMARGLYEGQPVFQASVDECADILRGELGCDIREVLFAHADDGRLHETRLAQPALFVIEYSLALLLESWGIRAAAMVGHSLGEYVAACLAGVFDLRSALRLVAARGRLMQDMPAGAMLACRMAEDALQPLLAATGCSLAAVNGPMDMVASGDTGAIAQLRALLEERDIRCSLLRTSHAFHSWMMDPVLDAFRAELARVELKPPTRPFVSNVSGAFIADDQATSIDYWLSHLRGTVRFDAGIRTVLADTRFIASARVLVEVGPGVTLSSLVQKQAPKAKPVVSTLRHPQVTDNDSDVLLRALGQLWLTGVDIDWAAVHGNTRPRRVPLPTYPFERQRYWIDARKGSVVPAIAGKASSVEAWFYEPAWRLQSASLLPPSDAEADARWLLFADDTGVADAMAARLREAGQAVTLVRRADQRAATGADAGLVVQSPGQGDEYRQLLQRLSERGLDATHIVHLWSLDASSSFDAVQRAGTYSLLALTQAFMAAHPTQAVQLTVVTQGAWRVTGSEALVPAQATVSGLAKVVPQESDIRCFQVDVAAVGDSSSFSPDTLAAQLCREVALHDPDRQHEVALRGMQRWVRHYQVAQQPRKPVRTLRQGGVYLITGGLGNIGLALADHLARIVQARLVLVGRAALPPRSSWLDHLADASADAQLVHRLKALIALESTEAEFEIATADVADAAQLHETFARAHARFGRIDGVIHCAGKVHDAMVGLQELSPAQFEAHYEAKVHGLLALDRVLTGHAVDFCMVMSSLSAVLGGLGFGAYAAANAFADAFVHDRHSRGDERWLSVNWDGWAFGPSAAGDTFSMTPGEGVQAFAHALRSAWVPQLVNSTGALAERLEKWVERDAPGQTDLELHARPELESNFVRPRNAIEVRLAQSWQTLLGIDQVGVRDNFFALGGDSMLATRVISMIRHEFAVSDKVFSLKDFFMRPEIEAIALKIGSHLDGAEAEMRKSQLAEAGMQAEEGVL
ncbi:hybrid non-ribosomal peptide synthetase/type I polyketide synthase [Luteibacter sp. 9135]|uniref:hybrid non-ribosomal peptide synthetase/type I polyketide synthase n=1 Tax=Luteibacter sp. 9135 TaxID=1500893 RepID=UPI00056C9901|nr:hybrid non-ribosomal peptide synthetase/type I polyketide synthase [Luteibacter sp. 9135]